MGLLDQLYQKLDDEQSKINQYKAQGPELKTMDLDPRAQQTYGNLRGMYANPERLLERTQAGVEESGAPIGQTEESLTRSASALGGATDSSIMKALANRAQKNYGFELNKIKRKAELDAPQKLNEVNDQLTQMGLQSQAIKSAQTGDQLSAVSDRQQLIDNRMALDRQAQMMREQEERARKQARGAVIGSILGGVGTVAGFALGGGPAGAAAGGSVGGAIGKGVGG